jgi:uncharacterized protein YcfJ
MSIVSFEGRSNMFAYRDVKFRVQTILDSSNIVVRYNVHAKFGDNTKEQRIATKAGSWSEADALAEAQAEAKTIIDEMLTEG